MTYMKLGVIWPHRLQDYNVFVLKKDVEIFLKSYLEVKFDFWTYSNEKTTKLWSDSKPAYKLIGEKKIPFTWLIVSVE